MFLSILGGFFFFGFLWVEAVKSELVPFTSSF